MPYKTDKITDCLISFNNGETFESLNILPDHVQLSAEADESTNYRDIYKTDEYSFTGTFKIDHNALKELYDSSSRWDLYYTVKVQNRRHKKRRINKKWAKRYGYRLVEKVVEGLEIQNDDVAERCRRDNGQETDVWLKTFG